MIGVKRSTGFSGILGKIKIFIDGQEVAKINQGQQIELELPADEVTISVSQFTSRSNQLVVKNGQVVEITNSPWLRAYYLFLFVELFLLAFAIPDAYSNVAYYVLLTIAVTILVFKNVFQLKVIYP